MNKLIIIDIGNGGCVVESSSLLSFIFIPLILICLAILITFLIVKCKPFSLPDKVFPECKISGSKTTAKWKRIVRFFCLVIIFTIIEFLIINSCAF